MNVSRKLLAVISAMLLPYQLGCSLLATALFAPTPFAVAQESATPTYAEAKGSACESCHGSGKRTCDTCHGQDWTKQTCETCQGVDWTKQTCETCQGVDWTKLTCETCQGRDWTKLTCETCQGVDWTRLTCDRCNGSGALSGNRCYSCHGSGKKSRCYSCHGSGKKSRCYSCHGSGAKSRCYSCHGSTKKTRCYSCHGTAKKSRCYSCQGHAALGGVCSSCSGDGHVETIVATPTVTTHPTAENGTTYGEISDLTGRPKTVFVNGYYRKDGTYVRSHYRSPPGQGASERGPPLTLSPYVAENGSYYGQISDLTGRPKTVSVGGYYRKDGTYVRGHYRSSPSRGGRSGGRR